MHGTNWNCPRFLDLLGPSDPLSIKLQAQRIIQVERMIGEIAWMEEVHKVICQRQYPGCLNGCNSQSNDRNVRGKRCLKVGNNLFRTCCICIILGLPEK